MYCQADHLNKNYTMGKGKEVRTRTFIELPLFSMSIKCMKYCSLIVDNNWRRYISVIPSVMLNVGQFADIFLTHEPIDAKIRDAYFVVLWFNTLIRTTLLLYNRHRYEVFLEDVATAYREIEQDEDKEVNKMLVATTLSATGYAKMNIGLGILASAGFVMYPMFTSIRALPYGAHIPGIDKYASPWYEILFTFQFFVTIPGCCMYIPFTNLVVSLIMFSVLMNKVLQRRLRKLKDLKTSDVWPEVVWIIKYQMRIIRFVEIVNSLTTYIYLAEFLTCGALLCALLFLLNMVSSIGEVVIVVGYIIMILAQTSAMYWYANELYCESVQVSVEAYSSNWFDFDLKTQKALLLLIARAQMPCAILVGNVYPMTLEMFQSLLNTTYSYFTLLRRFYE